VRHECAPVYSETGLPHRIDPLDFRRSTSISRDTFPHRIKEQNMNHLNVTVIAASIGTDFQCLHQRASPIGDHDSTDGRRRDGSIRR